MPVIHHSVPASPVDPGLLQATHVFLRVDAVRRPLVPPYEGPFPVVSRSDNNKTCVILKRDKPVTVTVDRLKPAVSLPEASAVLSDPAVAVPAAAPVPSPALDPVVWPLPTRFGRRPRPSDRLNI